MNLFSKKTIVAENLYQLGLLSLVIAVIFFVFSYIGVGYTTNDETLIENSTLKFILDGSYFSLDGVINSVKSNGGGRIQSVVGYYSLTLPHWLSSALCGCCFNLLNLGSILLSLGLFSLVIYKITRQKLFAIFIALFFLVAIQNSWEHNVLTSYTFSMNFSIILLLISLVLFLEYLSSGRKALWGLSTIVFLLMLFSSYEFFLFYTIIFTFIAFYYKTRTTTSNRVIALKAFYISIPYFISVIIFVATYFLFKQAFPSSYLDTAPFSFVKVLNVVYQFTISSLPTYTYFHYAPLFDTYSDLTSGHNYTVGSFIQHLKVEWVVKSTVVVYFVYALLQSRLVTISGRMFIGLMLMSFYMMVIPNILVGVTAKYQAWVEFGTLSYTTTYHSFFGTVLLIVSSIIFFNQSLSNGLVLLAIRRVFIFLLTMGVAFISLTTDYSNYYVFKDQKLSQHKWKIVDAFVQSGGLQSVPPGSFIYAPSLWQHHGIVANHSSYWSDYMKLKYQKDVTVSNNLADFQKRFSENEIDGLYYLKFSQELKDYNQFILFAKVDEWNISQNQRLLPLASTAFFKVVWIPLMRE